MTARPRQKFMQFPSAKNKMRPRRYTHLLLTASVLILLTDCLPSQRLSAQTRAQTQPPSSELSAPPYSSGKKIKTQTAFDQEAAFAHLEMVCGFGRRFSTSQGMAAQQAFLKEHFEKLNAEIILQPFAARNPLDGSTVELANMIVRWHPNRTKRLLICCHYDTRPFPDLDRRNPQGVFIGANDGASGVAVLCELGQHLNLVDGDNVSHNTNDRRYGIDFAFFDGEEFVYDRRRDPMFLGSTHFANRYVAEGGAVAGNDNRLPLANPHRYTYAILIDMVGDKSLEIFYERNSLKYAPRLTQSIWGVAKRMNAKGFVTRPKHELRDDHLPLNTIARIPTCDIIDFDYPSPRRKHVFWHTEADVPENCSAKSLGTVGKVLLQWLIEMQELTRQ